MKYTVLFIVGIVCMVAIVVYVVATSERVEKVNTGFKTSAEMDSEIEKRSQK